MRGIGVRFDGDAAALAVQRPDARGDVNMRRLVKSGTTTACPHRGQAVHFDLQTEDGVIENAAWSYEEPNEAASVLAHYVAFDAARIDSLVETS